MDATGPTGSVPLQLPDGSTLFVSRLSAASVPAMTALLEALSFEDRRRRFFQAVPRVSPRFVHRLCEVDQRTQVAWLGASAVGPVFEVRYGVLSSEPRTAELAVTVHPDWRRRGVASTALRGLGVVASASGITQFVGDVLSDNRPSMGLLRSLGFTQRFESGSIVERGPIPPWTGSAAGAAALLRLHGLSPARDVAA
jgi:RimJ/RimL family protein N-acetyltransferase